jgi:LPXTG-site transpeptidase (sortase) family protein
MSKNRWKWGSFAWRRLALIVAAPLLSAVAGAALVTWLLGHSISSEQAVAPPTPAATVVPTITSAPPSEALIESLIIEKIGVDAPVEVRYVQADGLFPNPSGPEPVAWYDLGNYSASFNGRPGFGGNAVFAGHVDYINYGRAVFWDLNKLETGDQVKVKLADGTVYAYSVVWNERYPQAEIPWDRWLANDGMDMVTLLTCAGGWDGSDYSDRRAVRAELVSVTRPFQVAADATGQNQMTPLPELDP